MINISRVRFFLLWFVIVVGAVHAEESENPVRKLDQIEVDEKKLREAVASRTLSWLTGSSANNDYISVGRVANFFGFVGLRVASGQTLSRSKVATDALAILDEQQINELKQLVENQKSYLSDTNEARFAINRALEQIRLGEDIKQEDFFALGRAYGAAEAELGRVIAQSFGTIAQTLTSDQKLALSKVREAHVSGQGHTIPRSGLRLKMSKEDKKELVNSAARFLSWTTGSEEYNDFEVVGKPSQHFGFVSLRIASNHGVKRGELAKEVWSLLSDEQQQHISVAASHNATAFDDFLVARAKLMRSLEIALDGKVIDRGEVQRFGATVGEIEAAMTLSQASAMIGVRNTLTEAQSAKLLAMRSKYTMTDEVAGESTVDRGQRLYAQCMLCHAAGDRRTVAPGLANIVGRKIASSSSYDRYSTAIQSFAQSNIHWTESLLSSFLASPKTLIPGTTMGFDGFDDAADRAAVIAFLKTIE